MQNSSYTSSGSSSENDGILLVALEQNIENKKENDDGGEEDSNNTTSATRSKFATSRRPNEHNHQHQHRHPEKEGSRGTRTTTTSSLSEREEESNDRSRILDQQQVSNEEMTTKTTPTTASSSSSSRPRLFEHSNSLQYLASIAATMNKTDHSSRRSNNNTNSKPTSITRPIHPHLTITKRNYDSFPNPECLNMNPSSSSSSLLSSSLLLSSSSNIGRRENIMSYPQNSRSTLYHRSNDSFSSFDQYRRQTQHGNGSMMNSEFSHGTTPLNNGSINSSTYNTSGDTGGRSIPRESNGHSSSFGDILDPIPLLYTSSTVASAPSQPKSSNNDSSGYKPEICKLSRLAALFKPNNNINASLVPNSSFDNKLFKENPATFTPAAAISIERTTNTSEELEKKQKFILFVYMLFKRLNESLSLSKIISTEEEIMKISNLTTRVKDTVKECTACFRLSIEGYQPLMPVVIDKLRSLDGLHYYYDKAAGDLDRLWIQRISSVKPCSASRTSCNNLNNNNGSSSGTYRNNVKRRKSMNEGEYCLHPSEGMKRRKQQEKYFNHKAYITEV